MREISAALLILSDDLGACVSIAKIIRKGLVSLKREKSSSKETKRFKEIYRTVYEHAKKKGQSHKQALRYCWNVYSQQAPHKEKEIINGILRNSAMTSREKIREMIMREMMVVNEGDIIQMADYMPSGTTPAAEEGTPFEMLLSKIHTEMLNFMEENFESMTPEEGNYLDELLDSIEVALGIDEEAGIEVSGDDDDIIGDFEDED